MQLRRLYAPALVAVAFVAFAPADAFAQFGFKINVPGVKDPKQKLREIDQMVRDAEQKLPRQYGENPDKEKQAIAGAEAALKKAEGEMSGPLKLAGGDYDKVVGHINNVKAQIALARVQNKCSATRLEILKQHKVGKKASDGQIKAFDDAISALAAALGGKDASILKWWQDQAAQLKAENPKVEERAAELQRKARQQEQAKLVRQVSGEANRAHGAISEFLQKNDGEIPAAQLAALKSAADKVTVASPQAAKYYYAEHAMFSAINALRASDDPGPGVAKVFGGDNVKSGVSSGKKLEVQFAGKDDWCYTVYTHWKNWTSGERVDHFDLDAKGHGTLQHYGWYRQNAQYMKIAGACLNKSATVHIEADLTFAGSRNGLRYAVVGWPRAKLPVSQATYAGVWIRDTCDTDAWLSMWKNPVPGSLVYVGAEPFLMDSPDRAGQSWTSLRTATYGSTRAKKDSLSSKAPPKIAFKTQFHFTGCTKDIKTAEHPDTVAYVKCGIAHWKKYDPQYDRLNSKIKNPSSLKEWGDSKKALERLQEQDGKEWQRNCGSIEQKIKKRWEATFNKIVDMYTDKPQSDRLDRAGQLADEDEVDTSVR